MKPFLLPALVSTSLPLLAFGQTEDTGTGQIIVTASRIEQPLDTAIASVTVITRTDIEQLQPHSVDELLNGLAGISGSVTGDLGKSTEIYLRGTNADHVLVLIDGVRIGAATTGIAAWEQLPVEQIERIEIVRGPTSSLYGSEALGGVVQIFTRHGSEGGPALPSFGVGGGSHGTRQGEAGFSGSARQGWYNASISALYTDGIPICVAGAPVTASCYTTTPQQGYWSGAAAVSGGYRWDMATGTLDFLRVDGDTRYDGNIFAGDESRLAQQVLGGTVRLVPIGSLNVTLAAGQSLDRSLQFFGGSPDGFFNTRRETFSWLNEWSVTSAHKLLFGADFERDVIASDTHFAVRSRKDTGVFVLYQWWAGRHELQLSGRHDHNEQFGNHSTGSAQWAYRLTDLLRFTTSYGTAFKAPTFNDLYFPFFGDPNLQPETSHSIEAGLNGASRYVNWSVNAYETRIDHLIEYNPVTFSAANIDRARIRGVEAQFGARTAVWRAQLQLTLLDPRDAAVNDGKLLPRRARYTTRLDVDRDIDAFSIGATLFANGPRFEDPANAQPLRGYETLDLRATWRLQPRWEVQALLKNTLNRNYQTALYYNQPGRSAYLALRYMPVKS